LFLNAIERRPLPPHLKWVICSVLPVVFAVSLHKVSKVVVCAPAPSVRHRSWFFFSKPIFEQKKMFDPRVAVSLWYW
jgi:hypothetical protein